MNDVGKPCARNPHARFDRGPLAKRTTVDDERETRGPAPGTRPPRRPASGLPYHLAADQLDRFPELSLYRVIDLEAAGFSVVPTFRTPHVTVAFDGDLDSGLAALAGTVHEQRRNPYHGPDEPEEAPE